MFLAVGQNTCNYFVYSCLFTYGCSSFFVISCQHDHTDSHGLKLTYGLGAVFFDDISNRNYSCCLAVLRKNQRRLSLLRQRLRMMQQSGNFCISCIGLLLLQNLSYILHTAAVQFFAI